MSTIVIGGKTWDFNEDRPLGSPGGFGAVFLGADEHRNPVAVKRLHLTAEKHVGREIQISEYLTGHEHPHVIPIYAAGKDEVTGRYFILMAKADRSLSDLIDESAPLPEQDVIEILAAIAMGLAEIGELVHRDLKPGNILLHNGIWKLADLGLARFVEAATASNTMKDFLSFEYAAPEQWRGERVTKSTDVYALGCILYALITGQPPFPGPNQPDYSDQHQSSQPPALPASDRLRRLAISCLAKRQELRPSIQSLRTQIDRLHSPNVLPPANALVAAATVIAERVSKEEAEQLQRRKIEEDRRAAAGEAVSQLNDMFDQFLVLVMREAPDAESLETKYQKNPEMLAGTPSRRGIELGRGWLIVDVPYPYLEVGMHGTGWDVLVGGVVQVVDSYTPPKGQRSANLWFGKIGGDTSYRWWEAGYMLTADAFQWFPVFAHGHAVAPFAIEEQNRSLGGSRYGLSSLKYDYRLAYNPKPIDGEYFDDWCARWTNWFGQMVLGQLTRSRPLPEEPIDPRFSIRIV